MSKKVNVPLRAQVVHLDAAPHVEQRDGGIFWVARVSDDAGNTAVHQYGWRPVECSFPSGQRIQEFHFSCWMAIHFQLVESYPSIRLPDGSEYSNDYVAGHRAYLADACARGVL